MDEAENLRELDLLIYFQQKELLQRFIKMVMLNLGVIHRDPMEEIFHELDLQVFFLIDTLLQDLRRMGVL